MSYYSIPILFVVFNRLEIAMRSLESIRNQRPCRLYIASDGARTTRRGERETVDKVRKTILESIDWPCEVKTLFQENNLGCGQGVYTAINWLFQNEEYGIVLEDDCVANDSFFRFMEEMLIKYKDDTRIGMIAGSNLITSYNGPERSYIFSRYKSCWGWGSWRRAWQNMDINMSWRKTHLKDVVANSGYYGRGASKWHNQLKCIDSNYVSAWDWQWYFSLSAQNQLCIYPGVNLVSNIGDGVDATHTSFGKITYESHELKFPLDHPIYILPCEDFDKQFYLSENTIMAQIKRLLPQNLKFIVKKILK